ncbi:MAG: DUF2062 domain-containing protein [Pseudomonadota bacterium]
MAPRHLKRSLFFRLYRRIRYTYLRLILLPDTPHRVALGLAAGVFTGLLPIIPFQSITGIALAWVLRGSKIAVPIGALITNPLTIPFFYPAFYYLGRTLTPFGRRTHLPEHWALTDLLNLGTDAALASLLGGLIMAIVLAPISYFLFRRYFTRLQKWERKKLRKRLGLSPPPTV